MRRPSASVERISTVFPDIIRRTSPGRYAVPEGMFSTAGTTATRFRRIPRAAAARSVASIAAPPAMSYFIFSIPSHFLREMPPVSKVTPFPTRAVQGAPGLPPRYSATISRGGAGLPFATARIPPALRAVSSGRPRTRTRTLRAAAAPIPRPTSRAARARPSGRSSAGGVATRERPQLIASPTRAPRDTPSRTAGNAFASRST